jgi:hypothetical protein
MGFGEHLAQFFGLTRGNLERRTAPTTTVSHFRVDICRPWVARVHPTGVADDALHDLGFVVLRPQFEKISQVALQSPALRSASAEMGAIPRDFTHR